MAVSNVQINPTQSFKVTFTVTASAAVNSVFAGTFYQNQTDVTGVTQLPVPPNQIWKIVDFYVSTTQTPDAIVDFLIGNTPQNVNLDMNATSLGLGTTRINTLAYMANGGLFIGANVQVQAKAAIQASNATTVAATLTATMVVAAYPIPSK